jgi:hypothetical protein
MTQHFFFKLSVTFSHRHAECRSAECRCTECRGAWQRGSNVLAIKTVEILNAFFSVSLFKKCATTFNHVALNLVLFFLLVPK